MKVKYLFLIFIASSLFSYDLNSIGKDKEVWTDPVINLNHQFQLMVGFGRATDYLCLYRASDYKNYSNIKDDNTNSIGFKAILDNPSCGTAETNSPWIFKSEQVSSNSDLVIEMFNPKDTTDTRSKLILKEETSTANPFGILTLDYNLTLKESQLALYGATFESTRLGNNDIEFKTAVYVDEVLISPSTGAGQASEFYASKVVHTPNSGGTGSVSSFYWHSSTDNFPAATASEVGTTNFAYDSNYVRYHRIDGLGAGTTSDRCLKRDTYWTYIPYWIGYGIYDANGDRLTGTNLNISVSFTGLDTAGGSFSGTLVIHSGSSILMNTACKKVKDGSHYDGNNVCPGTVGQVHLPVTIGGEVYENFPLLNIPNETILTDGSSNEYYVRVVRPRKVYAEEPISSCASLTVPASMDTPDHNFFNYPVQTIPRSGAILVNEYSNDTSKDLYASGVKYSKNLDQDGDGVLNFLDAFPTDPSKSKDADYDGIDDSTDGNISQFVPAIDKKLGQSLYSGYIK